MDSWTTGGKRERKELRETERAIITLAHIPITHTAETGVVDELLHRVKYFLKRGELTETRGITPFFTTPVDGFSRGSCFFSSQLLLRVTVLPACVRPMSRYMEIINE